MQLLNITEVHLQSGLLASSKTNEATSRSLFFTISDFTGTNCFYKSPISNDVICPSWSCGDFFSLNKEFSELESVYFRFFVSTSCDQNETLLEAPIRLQFLHKLGSELPTKSSADDPCDRIIFRRDDEYLTWTKKSDMALLPKKSYSVAQLKSILTLEKKLAFNKSRFTEIYAQFSHYHQKTLGMLVKQNKSAHLNQQISILHSRIAEGKRRLSRLAMRAEEIHQENIVIDKQNVLLEKAALVCHEKFARTDERVTEYRVSVAQLLRILNLRKYYMITELCSLFPIEVVGGILKKNSASSSDYRMTICNTLLLESDTPGTSSTTVASFVDIGTGLAPKPHPAVGENREEQTNQPHLADNDTSEMLQLTQSARSLLLANNPYTASVGLGHVATFLRLLSHILNIPLRYPIQPPVGTYRTRIIDHVIPDLEEVERSFPLYMQRNVALATFRYAVFLLNRDIAILRGFFGLNTPNQRASLWNLKHLIDSRLLRVNLRHRQLLRLPPIPQPKTSKESEQDNADGKLLSTTKTQTQNDLLLDVGFLRPV